MEKLADERNFLYSKTVQTGSGAHLVSNSVGSRVLC